MTKRVLIVFVLGATAGLSSSAKDAVGQADRGTRGAPATARADSKPAPSLEEQLLEDLGVDPLDDEVHKELLAPDDGQSGQGASPGGEGETSAEDGDDFKRQLERELGAAAASEEDHPLLDIARRMRLAEDLIGESKSGSQTQDLQEQIVAKLEELLKQARSCSKKAGECEAQGVAARQPAGQPRQKPSVAGRKPGSKPVSNPNAAPGTSDVQRPNLQERENLVKSVWGELPPNLREQVLQLSIEEFLPKYELLIEAYFKRLAREQEGIDSP